MSAKTWLKLGLVASTAWSTHTVALPAAGVINGQSTNLPLGKEYVEGLTTDEQDLISKLRIYQDIQDKNTYYYSAPLTLAAAPGSTQAWSENRNGTVFKAAQEIVKMTINLGNSYQKILAGVVTSHATDPLAEATEISTASETLARRLKDELSNLNSIQQGAYIEGVKAYAVAAGITLPPGTVWNLESASQLVATILRAPAVSVQVPVGFGFSRDTLQAVAKYTAANASKFTLNPLRTGPAWLMGAVKFLPDNQTQTGRADYEAAANVTNDLFSSITDTVASAGGTFTLKYTYSGAVSIGHGTVDPKDPLAQNLTMNQYLSGFLTQEQELSYRVSTTVKCSFNASVKEDQTISSARYPDGYVVLPKVAETPNDPINIARCDAVDAAGNVLPTEIDDAKRTALQKVVEAKKQEFLARYTSVYTAALSLKQRLVDEAKTRVNAWKLLPLPTETRVLHDKELATQCTAAWGPEECVEFGKHWNYRKFRNESYCKRSAPKQVTSCSQVYKAIDRLIDVKVPAFYVDRVKFDQLINGSESYDIAATETVKVRITTGQEVCFARDASLQRTACSGSQANQGDQTRSIDTIANPSTRLPISIN